jgi:hypothetical protein
VKEWGGESVPAHTGVCVSAVALRPYPFTAINADWTSCPLFEDVDPSTDVSPHLAPMPPRTGESTPASTVGSVPRVTAQSKPGCVEVPGLPLANGRGQLPRPRLACLPPASPEVKVAALNYPGMSTLTPPGRRGSRSPNPARSRYAPPPAADGFSGSNPLRAFEALFAGLQRSERIVFAVLHRGEARGRAR